jgi:pilus assembly protein Flp/PilA
MIKRQFKKIINDTKGATSMEYGLIIALMVIAIIAGVSNFSSATSNMYNSITNQVSNSAGV